jgi:hypothetical protein
VIVPGPYTVVAKCDRCRCFVNPGEISTGTLRPAEWKKAFGGICKTCDNRR